jgi:hypothetical protein
VEFTSSASGLRSSLRCGRAVALAVDKSTGEAPITTFDSDFETAFGEASGATFGEPMDYAGPGGSPVVLAVPVILDDTTEPLDAGSGFGAMRAARRTGTAFRKAFLAAGVEPVKGGTFTRSSGAVLTLSEAPTGPDSVGQYSFDFGGS